MKLTITAVSAVELPKPFNVALEAGETLVSQIRLGDLLLKEWMEVVQQAAKGHITLVWDPRAEAIFPEDEYIARFIGTSGSMASGVANLAALRAVTQEDRADRQIRLVESENALYRFDLGTLVGGEAPDDVVDGNWFNIGTVAAVWGVVGEMIANGPDVAAGAGVVSKMARIDHTHAINTALVGSITTQAPGDSANAGAANNFARGDHTHGMTAGVVGEVATLGPDNAVSVGGVHKFAEIGHIHPVATGAVGVIAAVGTAAGAGTQNSYSRSDHVHALAATPAHLSNGTLGAAAGQLTFKMGFDVTGAQNGKIWDANCPRKCRIVDAYVIGSAISGGGTVTVYDGDPAGGGTAITDAMACAAVGTVSRLTQFGAGSADVADAGTLWYGKNAAGDAGILIIECLPIA